MSKKYRVIVGVLTYNRSELLKKTLQSFISNIDVRDCEMSFYIFDNGSSKEVLKEVKKIAIEYNAVLTMLGKEKVSSKTNKERDKNISYGHKRLAQLMCSQDADGYLLLEDDWECTEEFKIEPLVKFLSNNDDIGQIRLRDYKYDGSLMGGSNRNLATNTLITWDEEIQINDLYKITKGNLHWVNNPSIISPSALKLLLEGFKDELDCMRKFGEIYPNNAQMFPGVFKHIGQWRIREDLIEDGLFEVPKRIYHRFDDIYKYSDNLEKFLKRIDKLDVPYILGIVPGRIEEKTIKLINSLKNSIIFQHGYLHINKVDNGWLDEFPEMESTNNIKEKLTIGKKLIEDNFFIKVEGYIPPWNNTSHKTIRILEDLGFNIYSSQLNNPVTTKMEELNIMFDIVEKYEPRLILKDLNQYKLEIYNYISSYNSRLNLVGIMYHINELDDYELNKVFEFIEFFSKYTIEKKKLIKID